MGEDRGDDLAELREGDRIAADPKAGYRRGHTLPGWKGQVRSGVRRAITSSQREGMQRTPKTPTLIFM